VALHELFITGRVDTLERFLAWVGPEFQPTVEYSSDLPPPPEPYTTYVVRMEEHTLTITETPASAGWLVKKRHLASLLGKVFPRLCHGGTTRLAHCEHNHLGLPWPRCPIPPLEVRSDNGM
jgi:hypothetical protein